MRKLVIVTTPFSTQPLGGNGVFLSETVTDLNLNIATLSFKNAKKLLGQTLDYVIYDMQSEEGVCFNLDALAIATGTIIDNGYLIIICPQWHHLTQQIDLDAIRWSEQGKIKSPNFFNYFQQLVEQFQFEIVEKFDFNKLTSGTIFSKICKFSTLTVQQQLIFEKLPQHSADIHLITAPRGRGKSTLLGQLAQYIQQNQKVIITARSHSALPTFWKNVDKDKILFFPPDQLIQQIENQLLDNNYWLFIDEAASLPLPMLQQFSHYFKKVILATTTQNYEGTGRGFSLKFLPQLKRPYQQWKLTKALRWKNNDSLENFVNQLLILDNVENSDPNSNQAFYQLLANAHYKTTPTDLRRLFDAPHQYYLKHIENHQLIGGIWAIFEGGLDKGLAEEIWQGKRRPQGNLVAQYLCFQGNLIEACLLRSIRISRIAVTPEKQQQGIGKRLVSQLILQIRTQQNVDFISVSFGLNEKLFNFWKSCGFQLVQISPSKEASSGYHSAMMLYPISEKGLTFIKQAQMQFQRDFPLLPFLQNLQKIVKIVPLEHQFVFMENDHKNLQGFAYYHRSLTSCYASLKRLQKRYAIELEQLKNMPNSDNLQLPNYKKLWLKQFRISVANILNYHSNT
ncbi:GNAT family N-acetyltransferase [Pasteurella atlantica]|uniref:GNAT family N-acetyltransferase n=2 Tax=Pasteurellaceae TaxID=712 RepID=A0ACC6HJN2_9PAST|nr:GNAT family N-acetyltransferase [Pasteurella atlantica]MDP8050959.1 GNAT family N-acetyltransferase [Pasteurella atlantica]MDP8104228.1 GNAT family N-acetyltransferase [Pasteurella atlantica]MDP8147615.1 GNAT family N-acetyltransferase [Pasteurella atlantica]